MTYFDIQLTVRRHRESGRTQPPKRSAPQTPHLCPRGLPVSSPSARAQGTREPRALLKMHLIRRPLQATIAGLSARLSVGPPRPAGEDEGRWFHLRAPVLT